MSAGPRFSRYSSLYLSTVMSTGFYGITCMQTFFYYVHYQHDSLRMKSFVATVCAFNTIHEALTISGTYKYIMASLMDPLPMSNGVTELFILFTSLVAISTQGFFMYRIYDFSGKNLVAPFIWIPLAFYQIASPAIYIGKAFYTADGIHVAELGAPFFRDLAISGLSIAAGVDVLIAIFMIFLLLRKGPINFTGALYILQPLAMFAVNTGIWPATFALLTLLLLFLYPSDSLYMVFGIPLCSVYCHTLLANLNARPHVRSDMLTGHHVDSWVTGNCNIFHQQSGETKSNHTSAAHPEHHRDVTSPHAGPSVELENVRDTVEP